MLALATLHDIRLCPKCLYLGDPVARVNCARHEPVQPWEMV